MNKDNLIEFAKEQCEIFPEDSYMGKYLRETMKILQAESCADCVSRGELKKWLDMNFSFGGASRKIELFDRLDKELPPVTPTQRWIPVSERLPEKDVEVLATTEWGGVTIAMYCVIDWFIHEGATNAETDEIVAWMPLPEPYKEGKEE